MTNNTYEVCALIGIWIAGKLFALYVATMLLKANKGDDK